MGHKGSRRVVVSWSITSRPRTTKQTACLNCSYGWRGTKICWLVLRGCLVTQPVNVYYLLGEGTIDDLIWPLVNTKLEVQRSPDSSLSSVLHHM